MQMSPFDRTLEKVGMGPYQWKLLVLCGFGWLSDNMWLQSIAIIIPRVQIHFKISDRWIGLLPTSIFCGMMIGAWMWGSYSDSHGRRNPFIGTLFLTTLCGLLSSLATTFKWLCFLIFCIGIGVGGSMPTDGTLFLENIPKTRHYLLTGLSSFFSLGSIVASLLGLTILPSWSCPEPIAGSINECDVETQNSGWRYFLVALSLVTFVMSLSRISLFKIKESPKYLIAKGRSADAILVLEEISIHNGHGLTLSEPDVVDHSDSGSNRLGDGYARLGSHTRAPELSTRAAGWRSSLTNARNEFFQRLQILLSPEWRTITVTIWAIWVVVSYANTSFNVFLPIYLEQKNAGKDKIQDTLKEYLVYTLAGFPGSFLGSWMTETRLGRRNTMVLSTLGTALSVLGFLEITNRLGSKLMGMLVSLLATIMYAVIYSYTPEVFPSLIRGTGYGIASALSRVSGMMAPLVASQIIKTINIQSALWIAVFGFFLATILMAKLPRETRNGGGGGDHEFEDT